MIKNVRMCLFSTKNSILQRNANFIRKLVYKSDLALSSVYPSSSLRLYTPVPPNSNDGKFSGYIPIKELEVKYIRSSGPGGQHVNTTNTKVEIRFNLSKASWLPQATREKLQAELQNRLTKDGELIIQSDLTRTQTLNMADALEKLRSLIRQYDNEALPPSEETLEKLRRRQERAGRVRLQEKRTRSQTKANRGSF